MHAGLVRRIRVCVADIFPIRLFVHSAELKKLLDRMALIIIYYTVHFWTKGLSLPF